VPGLSAKNALKSLIALWRPARLTLQAYDIEGEIDFCAALHYILKQCKLSLGGGDMSLGLQRFKLTEIRRVLKGCEEAGIPIAKLIMTDDGYIEVIPATSSRKTLGEPEADAA
jgi:hypothetical protein